MKNRTMVHKFERARDRPGAIEGDRSDRAPIGRLRQSGELHSKISLRQKSGGAVAEVGG
jgi:hypothetical protein